MDDTRDPNDITDEPRKWFKATEEWLDARCALSSVASEAATLDSVAKELRERAGAAFAAGKDDKAAVLRGEANAFSDKAKERHREREKRLKELDLISPGYGPSDLAPD